MTGDPPSPAAIRYFEDYPLDSAYEYGPVSVTEAEIIAFARQFDPQPIHIDREAAASGPFGGLIASGWHTAGLMMRLLATHFLSSTSIASPGIDELRWRAPVRPGDQLRIRVRITEAARSRSKPDRGMIRSAIEVINQHDTVVMSLSAMNLIRCRPS
ncbi:MAG: MaoC family dehydratase [Acidibrevibacterium sp.]|jgi:acyl dehydratase|uniref:MaoC family dehydratase n=1 Tax=Acidibrevibacterium fodinaquatile TaxID=1969806 RepID=UPI000E0D135D|nr:MaoC family dehydratase [Acidibrevibacterium fodinaquatile]MCA7119980.1 MaoC family dehydratase [Acidibrevibacterium fodinaquatile]